jgi:hypothetical protein
MACVVEASSVAVDFESFPIVFFSDHSQKFMGVIRVKWATTESVISASLRVSLPRRKVNSAVGGVVKTSGFRYIRLGKYPQWSRYSCEVRIVSAQ